jgi:hypothetical protein
LRYQSLVAQLMINACRVVGVSIVADVIFFFFLELCLNATATGSGWKPGLFELAAESIRLKCSELHSMLGLFVRDGSSFGNALLACLLACRSPVNTAQFSSV